MRKFARLTAPNPEGAQRIIDLVDGDPAGRFHPLLVTEFVEVPDETTRLSTKDGETWTHYAMPVSETPVVPFRTIGSPGEFQRLFTLTERMAIDRARDLAVIDAITDEVQRTAARELKRALDIFFGDLGDPLLQSVDVLHPDIAVGLESVRAAGLIEDHRPAEIQQGWPL